MVVLIAAVAVICSSLPHPLADPIATSTAAVLMALILSILGRRQDPRLFRAVLLLATMIAAAAVARQSYSLWMRAQRYRRLSDHHMRLEMLSSRQIESLDRDPWKAGGRGGWARTRPRWLQWVEYHRLLKIKYDKIARHAWRPVEPDPEPP
jgi:hypothetical protein